MLKMFAFVITLASGHASSYPFAVESDCHVAHDFAVRENPTAKVSECESKWYKK